MNEKMPFERLYAPQIEELNELLPQYHFIELLSIGGMGAIYKAEQRSLGRLCAIKILPRRYSREKNFVTSFESELKLLAKLNHENLVHVYDFGIVDQMYFVSMEYVDGISLDELVGETKMSHITTAKIARSIASGLMHAHRKGVIHRDIKPVNVIIDKEGKVKLVDYGIAHFAGQVAEIDDVIWGTVGYKAPEVVSGETKGDKSSDIFSLGCLICFCVMGYTPDVLSKNEQGLLNKLKNLKPIVVKATDPDREERFESIKQMQKALKIFIKLEKKADNIAATEKLIAQVVEAEKAKHKLAGEDEETKEVSDIAVLKLRGNTAETGEIVIDNRYILRQFIKSLPIGAVYLGYDQTLERKIVITLIHAEQEFLWKEGFMSIASELSALEHPNIPRTIDAGVAFQEAYIVSQYIKGQNLYDLMTERKMSVSEVMECATDIFSALVHASYLGFTNQMISPESILSCERPIKGRRYYLSNMGIGRVASLISLHTTTPTSPIFDSALLAPELLESESKGEVTSVYMIGHLVYYLLGSGHPYAYLPYSEAYLLHIKGDLPDIREFRASVPKEISEWIKHCIEVKASYRFQTLKEASDALQNILKDYENQENN